MKDTIQVLIIQFQNEIKQSEIPLFRGAVINSVKEKNNVLYHNHIDDSFNYTYPKIQYKRIRGKAAIVCIEDGTEAIGEFFSVNSHQFQLGERIINIEVDSIHPINYRVQAWQTLFHYRINRWLPLNSINYKLYMELEGLLEKIKFLEKILTANLLSFAKGIELHIDSEIQCQLTQLSEPYLVVHKGIKLMSFNIEFKTNLSIPNYIGIGKSASLGYGIITQIKKDVNKNNI